MTIESIVEILQLKGHFRQAPKLVHIADADLKFDFDAILVGPGNEGGIVLVLDAADKALGAILRKLKAFSLVLDRSGSMRPMTLVLVTRDPDDPNIAALEEFTRVIVVSPERDTETCLRALLPLHLPKPLKSTESAEAALRDELGDDIRDPLITRLLKAGLKGSTDVESKMREVIDRLASEAFKDKENQ